MALVEFQGPERLVSLAIVPPQVDSSLATAGDSTGIVSLEPDWTPLFTAAGLDLAEFTETTPVWVPGDAFDKQREWIGVAPWDREVPLRVSAASWRGQPVRFDVRGPWVRPTLMERPASRTSRLVANLVNGMLVLGLVFLGLYLAWRNLRLGRGDRRGAARIAITLVLSSMVTWGVSAHHVLDLTSEMYLFFIGFGGALIQGALFGAVYLAFEPHARRAAPHLLIGWARALEGQWRDARVGRELLIGGAGGGLLAVVTLLTNAVPTWIPFEGQTPIQPDMLAVAGGAAVAQEEQDQFRSGRCGKSPQ
jgi:hypothetical protein